MNKRHYKVIFSRVLNQLVVVSELAKSQGKAQSENVSSEQEKTGLFSTALSLNPIHFSLMLALGFVFLSPSVHAEDMAIRADKPAPGNQQPTVLQTGNGLPQVNIQTPSAGGVSRNQYSQFDVAEKGAVLNNARKAAQTQMAGWVQGNPNLARGEAKVILNEVNSANPSRLKGYVEVAGKKADVVIANPSGIQCDGCGVINAGRTTLTTGKADVENGELKGYRVKGGKVTVGQKGMDNSQSDYTDIIAEKAEIKGGVWSKKGIKVTTGKNNVDRTNDSVVYVGDKNTDNTDRTSDTQGENQSYSVDVSQLGGMYAEKIHLVDNGQGLGVRNAGHIGASAGDVKIDSQGRIVNEGVISATHQADLNAEKVIENKGKVETKQGNVALRSQTRVEQHGSIVSHQGGSFVQAKDKVTQTGETVAKGDIQYQAKNIEVKSGALVAAGVTVQDTTQGEIRSLDTQHAQGANLTLSAEKTISSKAKHLASGEINVRAEMVDLSDSQLSGDRIALQSAQSALNLNKTTLYSEGKTTLSNPNLISTENAHLNADHFVVDSVQLNNHQGSWIQRGAEAFALNVQKGLDNTEGKIVAEGTLSVQTPLIQNNQGVIWSNQGVKLNTNAGHIESQSGYLFGKNSLDISTSTLNNQKGEMLGGQVLLAAQQVNNEEGKLIVGNRADLSVNQFNNQRGIVYNQGELSLKTENLHNQDGIISSVSRATLLANDLNNLKGVIQGESDLTIQTQNLNNTQGDISAKTAAISSAAINNAQGVISSQDLTLSGTNLNNKGGIVQSVNATLNLTKMDNQSEGDKGSLVSATNRLVLNVTNVNNKNTKAKQDTPTQGIQTTNLVINAEHIENQSGGIYAGKSANITVNQSLDNQQGEILSAGRVDIVNPDLTLVVNNALGKIESVIGTTLQAKTLADEGSIRTKGDLGIELNDSFTLNKAFGVGNNLTFKTKGDFVNNSNLVVGNSASVEGATIQNNANAEISSINTRIQANKLDNFGLIDGDTTVIKANDVNNIGTARIYGSHLAIQANNLNNLENTDGTAATIAARERLDLGVSNLVNRNHSLIMSLGNIYIGGQLNDNNQATGYANSIDNGSATIEALGSGWIKTNRLLNHDLHLRLGHKYTKNHFVTYSPFDSSATYYSNEGEKGEGYLDHVNNSRHNSNQYFRFNDGRKAVAARNWLKQDYIRTTDTNTIEHQDPSKLLIGQSLHLEGGEYTNKHSRIVIGDTLYLADKAIKEPVSTVSQGLLKLSNIDVDGEIHRRDIGLKKDIKKEHRHHGSRGKKVWAVYGGDEQKIDRLLPVEPFKFGLELLKIGEPVESTGIIVGDKSDFQGISLAEKTPLNTDLNVHRVNLEAITSGVMKNKDNLDIKTHLPDISLPQASLYKINPEVSGQFLVETDPRFTQKSKWLSSDYMFKQLRNDPQNMLKRLGDGFYEQRLVNEQINQLTGRRFLENYSSDYDQYKALMDNGAYYAQKMNLVPGVALTSSQMKELTSDMVWMVKREVTLKDGSKKEVLVPQVYVVGRNTDIDSRGAVISANDVIMNIKGDVQNSGVISGRNLTGLAANNIENLGGRLQGRELYLVAKNMLNNLGGELNATDHLVAQGKHINIESTTSETENTPDFYQKSLTQQASVKVGNDNKKGSASFIATENITVKGANVDVNGNVVFSAGKALNFGTVETENKEHYVPNADNYYKLDQKQEVGSQLNVTGNLDAVGKSAVEMRGVSVTSNGTMNVLSDGNINIQEARYKEQLSSASKSKSRGLTSSTTEVYRHKHDYDVAEASNLDADKIYLHSSKGNVTIQGSNVAAGNGLTVKGKNIDIREAENRVYSDDFYSKKKSGMLGAGIGVAFGTQKQTTESDQTKLYAQSSQVGSLKGNTTMIAEQSYAQTASTVKAIEGDVNILAQKAEIKAADNKYETNTKQTFQQKGVTISLSSPVISAIQGVAKSAEMIGKSKHARVNAMTAANSAYNVVQAGQALGELAGAASGAGQAAGGSTGLKISITYGQQQSESRTHTVGNTAAKSQVNAGGKVNIIATGAGKASNIDVVGSDIWGKQGTTLIADNQVNIKAAEQTHQERSTNKSSGFNAGVAIDIGKGVSAGLTVGGNYGKGYGNGDETTYVASHVGDIQSKTVIQAGGDANVIGSGIQGKRVELSAENLNIESLQNKASYDGKQMNVNGSITVGYGFSAEGGYSKSKMNSNHASVNEQAGIYAGDEGYDVNVKNHTDLKGALITSTQQAESSGLNQFSTGTLSHSDIENHSSYKGSSIGISAKGAAKGGWTGQEKNGISGSVGYGRESDNQNSVTKSGINTQNIEIRNENAQQALTGQSITETLAAIKTDISTDNAESQSGKLENRFDKNALQKELNIQVDATKGFVQTASAAGNAIANKLGEEAVAKQREAQAAQEAADRAYKANPSKENEAALNTANQNLITANNEADKWQTGGEYKRKIDGAMNAISAALGGLPAAGIATSAISPEINHQIKLATEGSPMANKVAHAVWGAVEAYSANQNAAAGAGGALAGEVMADVIAKELYGKKPNQLNREEKEVVSSVSQAAGALVGGMAANSSQGIGVGLTTAKNAVENNLLSKNEDEELFKISEKFEKAKELKQKEKNRGGELLKKDSYINFLIRLNQKDPSQLTEGQKNYLAVELHKIARSWNVPVSDLYNWDFSKEIKRNDSALTKYLSDEIKFWDSYVGKQAQSFATSALAAGGGVAAVRVIPKAVGYLQETAVLSARNPVAAEMVVTGGYKAGEISYKAHSGQYKTEDELKSAVYDGAKDVIKVPLLSKLKPGAQALNSFAFDLMYEVNKPGATDRQIRKEMIGSSAGSLSSLVVNGVLSGTPNINPAFKIFSNVIIGGYASEKSKSLYQDSLNQHEEKK